MTQITIELPDKLAAQLNAYPEANPQETLALLIDEALRIKLTPKDSSKLLELAGIVTENGGQQTTRRTGKLETACIGCWSADWFILCQRYLFGWLLVGCWLLVVGC